MLDRQTKKESLIIERFEVLPKSFKESISYELESKKNF